MQTISIDINKVQKGDETEFRLLFNLFYPRLMSVACRFVPEHIAEDIVQSVFVMYWEQKSALILYRQVRSGRHSGRRHQCGCHHRRNRVQQGRDHRCQHRFGCCRCDRLREEDTEL